jgi:cyclohexadienyl dehydratase
VRIAVNAGGHLERVARARFPSAAIEAVADNRAVLQRLLDGGADAALTDTAELRVWQRPGLSVVGPFSVDYKAYLLAADQTELAARVDAWMAAREADGWLNAERVRWLGADASMDAATASRMAIAALIALRLDLMPSVAAAKRAAGKPIDDPGQEERVLSRVGAMSSHATRVQAVYRQLIEMAKAIQHNAAGPVVAASLTDLRDAIARIDALLVREIDNAVPAPADTWQQTLGRALTQPGLSPAAIAQLADLLAASGSSSPGQRGSQAEPRGGRVTAAL